MRPAAGWRRTCASGSATHRWSPTARPASGRTRPLSPPITASSRRRHLRRSARLRMLATALNDLGAILEGIERAEEVRQGLHLAVETAMARYGSGRSRRAGGIAARAR